VLAGTVAFDGTDRGPLRVAAVQGGGIRGLRAVDADPEVVFQAHLAATRAGVRPGTVALVVWPEDVIDVNGPLAGSREGAEMARLSDELRATVVAGVVEDLPGAPRFRNAAVVWEPARGVVDRYDKVHLVPFGEYVPLRSLFERLADVSDVPRDAIAGTGPGVLDTAAGRHGVLISYEVFFADRARAAAKAGGRLLLVPTNASSYTTAQVPAQELAVARLRAVETGRWVVQAAPTGYSAVVDQRGRVRVRGPLGDRATLVADVRLRTGRTLAVRLGDAPMVIVAILALVVSRLSGGRSARKLRAEDSSFLPSDPQRE
jgi:apolipoprotein N-acyltransferase